MSSVVSTDHSFANRALNRALNGEVNCEVIVEVNSIAINGLQSSFYSPLNSSFYG